jgi:hydrogenase maturation factor
MLGEVEKNKLVSTSGARPGDMIILTKGIVIEGTAIIAREKQKELRDKGYSEKFIHRCQDFIYSPGLSVLKEALLANQFEIHAMHDPTEGGLSAGLYEIAVASQVGILIEREKVPILGESQKLCDEFRLNPLSVITSGTLLIIVPERESGKIIGLLEKEGIASYLIGEIKDKNFGIKIKTGNIEESLIYSAIDEITRIFK